MSRINRLLRSSEPEVKARARSPRSRAARPRDMDATPFAAILVRLLARVPGAYAAALVDREGESVDYAGSAEAFDIRVAAAHLRILLGEIDRIEKLGAVRSIVIRGTKKSIVARALEDDYALVVLLRRGAGFTASRRAFAACERDIALEAGWKAWRPENSHDVAWYPVDVQADRLGRPRRVGTMPVRVIGALVGLPPREHGFRVRTDNGNEITLVREARNCWYADDRL